MNDLQNRLFIFSVDVIKEIRTYPNSTEYRMISYQLIKSATSVGANYEEAQAAVSNPDFANKIGIALKEIRETNYWLRILEAINDNNEHVKTLKHESSELQKILTTIHFKVKSKT